MPSYKYDAESDSEPDEQTEHRGVEVSDGDDGDDGEPGPDDTFHFRHSFSKNRPQHAAASPDEDMNDPSFRAGEGEEGEEEEEDFTDRSYDEMQQDDSYLNEESILSEEEEEALQYGNHPLVTAVRIEKRSNWLEQIEYTDRAVKRLKAIDSRERMLNAKIHWGGRVPEIKYSTEDLERDLFGETTTVKSPLLLNCVF